MTGKMLPSLLLALLLCALLAPPAARALTLTPFTTRNQSPLVAIYGLPTAGSARVLDPGQATLELREDVASNFVEENRPGESLLLDGETYRSALVLHYGVGRRLEAGIEIPYVVHTGGFLDGFIIHWHDFFQLPQGGRDEAPRDRLTYRYQRDGRTLVDLTRQSAGFGDLRLTGAWQLWQEGPRALALHASLKLPTGDTAHLLGSGSTDLALWLAGQQNYRGGDLALFGAAGTLLMSHGDVLPDQQRHAVLFGTLGGGWRPLSWLALKTQIDAHSPFYRGSDLRALSLPSMQLVVGGTLGFSKNLSLDLAVSEDIIIETAPDVAFHLALRQRF